MTNTVGKLGFLSVLSIVIGSQIGSGTFIFPSLLAPFGVVGLFGWVVSVTGAISLAIIFAKLAANFPKGGGPHVYVTEAFGRSMGFFTAWIYWIISWSSNSVLLVTIIQYLTSLIGDISPVMTVILETIILFFVTFINANGAKFSGRIETFLVVLKILPLIVFPIIFIMYFNSDNFVISQKPVASNASIIAQTALLTCWGFIGIECATAPANTVNNPSKTIPLAIVIGTSVVALIYIINILSVIGVTGFDALINAKAPYTIAISKVFGQSGNIFMSILAMIVCIGSLNAWTLTGGQIARAAAEEGIFPHVFEKTNKHDAPVVSLWIAAFGTVPFFILEQINGLDSFNYLIDLLVSIFLFVYLFCCFAYIKLAKKLNASCIDYLLAILAICFCVFVMYSCILSSFITLIIFILSGVPVLLKVKHSQCRQQK